MVRSIAESARLGWLLVPCLVVPSILAPPVAALVQQELQSQPRLQQPSMLQLHYLHLPLRSVPPVQPLYAPKRDILLIEDSESRRVWIVWPRVMLLSEERWRLVLLVVQAVRSL
jgi:hypothetical protein